MYCRFSFVRAYNNTVHSSTGNVPSRVTNSGVLEIRRRMQTKKRGVHVTKAQYHAGQYVLISKEKMKFA